MIWIIYLFIYLVFLSKSKARENEVSCGWWWRLKSGGLKELRELGSWVKLLRLLVWAGGICEFVNCFFLGFV